MLRRVWRWSWRIGATLIAIVVIYCLIPIAPTVERMQPGPDRAYWDLATGHRISYRHVAAGAGAVARSPVVVLHGGPGGYIHSSLVAALAPLAARGHDLYFYDQVGSGLSQRLPRPKDYSFLGHVADLDAILRDEIAAPRVILIGHSYGGMLAAQYVALHPERVERLVLSSPGALEPSRFDDQGRWVNETLYPVPPDLAFVEVAGVAMDGARFWPARALASMAVATLLNVKLMGDAEADSVLDTLASRFTVNGVCDPAKVQPEEGGAGFYAHGGGNWFGDLADPRPLLARRELPVLVLQGACDYVPYAATYEYVDLFPQARYVFIQDAGHLIWWERPDRFLAEIEQFLAESEQAGTKSHPTADLDLAGEKRASSYQLRAKAVPIPGSDATSNVAPTRRA